MGTDTNINLQSLKQTTKQSRKTIPFTDLSIKNWRPTKNKEKIGFARQNTTRGLKIFYREKTRQKYWELTYYLDKDKRTLSLGPFVPGSNGTEKIQEKMLGLISTHKDLRRNHWLTDPRKSIEEADQLLVNEAKEKEEEIKALEELKKAEVSVNSVIESLCISGFPKVKIKDEFLSAVSIRTHINFLCGNNQRTEHLSYSEDSKGNGKIFFKPGGPQSFPELFQKYPSGVGIKKIQNWRSFSL